MIPWKDASRLGLDKGSALTHFGHEVLIDRWDDLIKPAEISGFEIYKREHRRASRNTEIGQCKPIWRCNICGTIDGPEAVRGSVNRQRKAVGRHAGCNYPNHNLFARTITIRIMRVQAKETGIGWLQVGEHQRAIGGIKGCFVIWGEKVKVLMPSVGNWQCSTDGNAQISVASLGNGLAYWWNLNQRGLA